MTFAIDSLTGVRVHVSLAPPHKAYLCEHAACGGLVFSTKFPGGNLAFRHSQNVHNDCIGTNAARCESWTPPAGYERPHAEQQRASSHVLRPAGSAPPQIGDSL